MSVSYKRYFCLAINMQDYDSFSFFVYASNPMEASSVSLDFVEKIVGCDRAKKYKLACHESVFREDVK